MLLNQFTRFFKLKKPSRFSYRPMFYNEEQEALEQRKKLIAQEMQTESNLNADDVQVRLRAKLEFARDKRLKRNPSANQNKKVLIIAAVLFLLIYIIFK